MKRTNKKNNKGFSLVELIIVMAIMAILVGIVGSQVIPYIEKSKIAKDKQVLSSLCTDAVSAFAMSAEDLNPSIDYKIVIEEGKTAVSGGTGFKDTELHAIAKTFAELQGCVGVSDKGEITDFGFDKGVKLESKDAVQDSKIITIEYKGTTGLVRVYSGATERAASKIGTITSK